MEIIPSYLGLLDRERMQRDLFYMSSDPLPCRQLNVTLPGHSKNTLYEADDYIAEQLSGCGYPVERQGVSVQCYRRDSTKPLSSQFSAPQPDDPRYTAYNLFFKRTGKTLPNDVIIVLAHKDSQSWVDMAPGANDNAIGTVGVMEIARSLQHYEPTRSLWFMFCNEEHTPWTSATAAQKLAASGKNVTAVLNMDGIGVKPVDQQKAGRMTNFSRYTTDEGMALAQLMSELNERYAIGLRQSIHRADIPNDDDGSFIKAGLPYAICNTGSIPYGDPNYHSVDDKPETVDVDNALLTCRLGLAFVLHLDQHGR